MSKGGKRVMTDTTVEAATIGAWPQDAESTLHRKILALHWAMPNRLNERITENCVPGFPSSDA